LKQIGIAQAYLAYTFHFQPSEMDNMDIDELDDWVEHANRINDEIRESMKE
jgi:hypothetical protein